MNYVQIRYRNVTPSYSLPLPGSLKTIVDDPILTANLLALS
jgi:hypothetical protein